MLFREDFIWWMVNAKLERGARKAWNVIGRIMIPLRCPCFDPWLLPHIAKGKVIK